MADETTPTEPQDGDTAADGATDDNGGADDNGTQDAGDQASDATTPADGTAPSEPVALADLPENIQTADEATLRELHAALDADRKSALDAARTSHAVTDRDRAALAHERQSAIAAELNRRVDERKQVAESLPAIEDAPAIPDAEPQLTHTAQAAAPARPGNGAASPASPTDRQPARVAAMAGENSDHRGQELRMDRLAEEAQRASRDRSLHGKAYLASVVGFGEDAPEPIADGTARVNDGLIREATESWAARRRIENARLAGATPSENDVRLAAICEPFDILRDVPDDFSTMEPVAGIWPQRPIGRLAVQFTPGIELADVEDGVAVWTETDQTGVDPDDSSTWKPCVEVDCPTPEDVTAEAVVACLTFPNTTEMSNPERVRNFMNAVNALRARVKEGRQLQIVDSLSHPYKYSGTYGAIPTLVAALNSLIVPLNFINRENEFGYTAILPPGLLSALGIDRANRAFGHEQDPASVLAQLQADVEGVSQWVVALDHTLSAAGEPHPDGLTAALSTIGDQTPPDVPELSDVYRVRLVDPSAAIYGETGELYEGVQRDPQLIRQNRAQWFAEEYFLLAKHGVQPWAYVDVSLCADGSRAGTIDPDTYPCGSAS